MADSNAKEPSKAQTAGAGCLVLILLAVLLTFCSGDGTPEVAEKADPAAMRSWQASIMSAGAPCDHALEPLTAAIASGGAASEVEAYRAATNAEAVCDEALTKLRALEPPPMPAEAGKKAGEAMETCRNAFASRSLMADRAAKIIDGDDKPSMLAEFGDFVGSSRAGMPLCATQVAGAMVAAGVTAASPPGESAE